MTKTRNHALQKKYENNMNAALYLKRYVTIVIVLSQRMARFYGSHMGWQIVFDRNGQKTTKRK